MMTSPEQPLTAFFEDMLHTIDGRPRLYDRLVGSVLLFPNDPKNQFNNLRHELNDTSNAVVSARWHTAPSVLQQRDWKKVGQNAIIGTDIAISTLRTIGNIYTQQAAAPQNLSKVRETTTRALSHVYKIAFGRSRVANENLDSMMTGFSPTNPLFYVVGPFKRENNVSPRAFIVDSDDAEQLVVRPRFPLKKSKGDLRCPATQVRLQHGERTQPALWSLLSLLGDVAIAEIYPTQFAIQSAD